MTAEEITKGIISRNFKTVKKARVNWKKEVKLERGRVLDEAISHIKSGMRNVPKQWHRGYFSAITKLEILKGDL